MRRVEHKQEPYVQIVPNAFVSCDLFHTDCRLAYCVVKFVSSLKGIGVSPKMTSGIKIAFVVSSFFTGILIRRLWFVFSIVHL